jgi:spermidine synthase
MRILLLFSIAVIATCGLIYELVAGTAASYLLGDSVTQFSTLIGVYLFAMGVGSFLSKYVKTNLLQTFIIVEILVGLIGGFSSAAFFILFNYIEAFGVVLYGMMFTTGVLVGLEIPLMMYILQNEFDFSDLVARVFSFDYAGALLASLAFPLFFVPHFGLIKTSLFFGLMNVSVALWLIFAKQKEMHKRGLHNIIFLKIIGISAFIVLFGTFIMGDKLMNYAETANFNEKIIYSASSKYQRITLTSTKQGNKLYLNGNLQFHSADEYRYHEALVHPCFTLFPKAKKILILGGGDGCAAREILKYPDIQSVKLVDLDPEMTRLFTQNPLLLHINDSSLLNPKMKVINADAFIWLKNDSTKYDIAIIDFPDPSNYSVGKLYTHSFYTELKKHLHTQSVISIQSTSPFVAPNAYWCINNTLTNAGFYVMPYHDFVPSFGDWGYVLAALKPDFQADYASLPKNLRFFDSTALNQMCIFPKDVAHRETAINTLNNQALVQYFEEEWGKVAN